LPKPPDAEPHLKIGAQQALQLGEGEIGSLRDLRPNVRLDLGGHPAAWAWPVTDPFRLTGLAPLRHQLGPPAVADSKMQRNRSQARRATVVRGQKLPPQVVVERSRHRVTSPKIARANQYYTIRENDLKVRRVGK
jgi:hypothetical protein